MSTEYVPRPPAVTEIKKSAWKRAPPINSPNAETVEEIRDLITLQEPWAEAWPYLSAERYGWRLSLTVNAPASFTAWST